MYTKPTRYWHGSIKLKDPITCLAWEIQLDWAIPTSRSPLRLPQEASLIESRNSTCICMSMLLKAGRVRWLKEGGDERN